MPDIREVYDMVTKQKPPEPGALARQQTRQVRSARNQKIGALVVAAVIGVAAIALVLTLRGGGDEPVPASGASPIGVATGFLTAYGAFDADQAITYLADDADLTDLSGSEGTVDEFRRWVSWLEAEGFEQFLAPCEAVTTSSFGTRVRCPFDFQAIRSGELGLGPFSGSSYDLRVLDGRITQASVSWETSDFSPQVWEPFERWVDTTYPSDAAIMYTDKSHSEARRTEASIRLWDERTREYVTIENGG